MSLSGFLVASTSFMSWNLKSGLSWGQSMIKERGIRLYFSQCSVLQSFPAQIDWRLLGADSVKIWRDMGLIRTQNCLFGILNLETRIWTDVHVLATLILTFILTNRGATYAFYEATVFVSLSSVVRTLVPFHFQKI